MPGVESDGERLTAAWLRQQGWPWQFEAEAGGRNLDFLATSPDGPVLLEVYEPELELPQTAGSFDSIAPVLSAFRARKAKQIAAAKKAGLPLMIVVGSANSPIDYGVHAIAGAMFGRPGVEISVGPSDPDPNAQTVFLGGGRVQPKRNRTVSAMAGIRRFNPTEWRLESAARSRGLGPDRTIRTDRQLREWARRREDLQRELTERGIFDPTASVARLVVMHNPFTQRPISPRVFGLYDEHYGITTVEGHSVYEHIAFGRLARIVPRVVDV